MMNASRRRNVISTLWIYVTVNYIYCDVFSLHHAPGLQKLLTGTVEGFEISELFLLAFSIVMELPMLMIVLAKILPIKTNRIANCTVAFVMTSIQLWTVLSGIK